MKIPSCSKSTIWNMKKKHLIEKRHFGTNDAEKRLPFWLCECKKVRVLENG